MVKRFDASIAKFGVDKAEKELGSLEDADGGIWGAKVTADADVTLTGSLRP